MKRKFLIFTLCFTLIFTSISYKKTYADGGIISLPVLAAVSTLAVGTGIVLNNIDDVYDIGRLFYDYVHINNQITWDVLETTLFSGVTVLQNGLVSVDSKFLDIVKGFFDTTFVKQSNGFVDNISYNYGLPINPYRHQNTIDCFNSIPAYPFELRSYVPGNDVLYNQYVTLKYVSSVSGAYNFNVVINGKNYGRLSVVNDRNYLNLKLGLSSTGYLCTMYWDSRNILWFDQTQIFIGLSDCPFDFPNTDAYNWDSLSDKFTDTGDLPLPIPVNLGDLVGKNSSDVWDNNYEGGLVGSGVLSIPNISNPSIIIDGSISFPNTGVENPPVDIPEVENPPIGGIIPSFPSFGDSLDFSPMYLTNINEKFPFSLPWDIGRLINKFDIEPKAPVFKVPIVTSEIELDLTIFDEWANIGRFFVLIGFALSLILISTKLLG